MRRKKGVPSGTVKNLEKHGGILSFSPSLSSDHLTEDDQGFCLFGLGALCQGEDEDALNRRHRALQLGAMERMQKMMKAWLDLRKDIQKVLDILQTPEQPAPQPAQTQGAYPEEKAASASTQQVNCELLAAEKMLEDAMKSSDIGLLETSIHQAEALGVSLELLVKAYKCKDTLQVSDRSGPTSPHSDAPSLEQQPAGPSRAIRLPASD